MRRVDVIDAAAAITRETIEGRHVLVMDVLRATSTIVTALNNGAKRIIPVETVEKAVALKRRYADSLLGGERGGVRQEGFDFGNSPLEYSKDSVLDKTIVLTTTNGTRALVGCQSAHAATIGCAGFLNGKAAVRRLMTRTGDLALVCAGTKNQFSLDDFLCAGMLLQQIMAEEEVLMTDLGWNALLMYQAYGENLPAVLDNAKHYQILKGLGFHEDLEYCLMKNKLEIAPVFDGNEIRID